MDEKEKIEAIQRAHHYAMKKGIDRVFGIPEREEAHLQGALDQDPISRKKRTEETVKIIDDVSKLILPGYPQSTTYTQAIVEIYSNEIKKRIEALP